MRIILVLLVSITALSAEARMYQWKESGVETTQLSGKPPAWYRSATNGPRIFVFDNGRLIDDTAVQVSDEVRQRMREEAFVLVEEERQKAKAKFAKAQETKDRLELKDEVEQIEDSKREEKQNQKSTLEFITESLFPAENQGEENEVDSSEKSLDKLRAIISDWEKSQTESAKQALQ